MQDIVTILYILGESFILNIFIILLTLIYIYMRRSKFSIYSIETKYFVFTLLWSSFAFLSAAKEGGNRGNIEAGIIVFIPFAIYVVNQIIKKHYNKLYFSFPLISVLMIGIFIYSTKIITNTNFLKKK